MQSPSSKQHNSFDRRRTKKTRCYIAEGCTAQHLLIKLPRPPVRAVSLADNTGGTRPMFGLELCYTNK